MAYSTISLCALMIAVGTVTSRTLSRNVRDGSVGCFNEHECCHVWSAGGHCSLNSRMTSSCKAACGFCTPNYDTRGCTDYHYLCLDKVRRGHCQTKPDWMAENCRKSCQLCHQAKCGVAQARSTVTGDSHQASKLFALSQEKCTESWIYFNGFCYKGFKEERTWEESRTSCSRVSLGAHLVAIGSEDENDFVFNNIVKGKANVQGWWIGIKRGSDDSETFITAADQNRKISYDNFAKAEPNNGLVRDGCLDYWYDSENCLEMYALNEQKGRWNDAKCHRRKPYICKQHELGAKKRT